MCSETKIFLGFFYSVARPKEGRLRGCNFIWGWQNRDVAEVCKIIIVPTPGTKLGVTNDTRPTCIDDMFYLVAEAFDLVVVGSENSIENRGIRKKIYVW